MDPLSRLGRKDKWFLGGGKGAIYAPPFPRFLLAPGFWDECYFGDVRMPRLFTVHILDSRDRPIRFESYLKGWRPDRLTIMHYAGDVVIRERRCISESNVWISELELVTAVRPLTAVMYGVFELRPRGSGTPWQSVSDVSVGHESIGFAWDTAWPTEVEPDRSGVDAERLSAGGQMGPVLPVHFSLAAGHVRKSLCVRFAQWHDDSPRWETSILPQEFVHGTFDNEVQIGGGPSPQEGYVHIAQHFELDDRRPIVFGCGAGLTRRDAEIAVREAVEAEPMERSARAWRKYFEGVPQFESSDEFLTNAYWNRWFGLRLNTVDIPGFSNFAPFVTEGVGFFRNLVSYSAQAHLREVGWMHDPSISLGIVENLRRRQRPDGSFPGHSYSGRPARDFYHADFATGIRQIEQLHGVDVDRHFLLRYLRYLETRLDENTQMIQVHDQNETGQEFMSRYSEASERADAWQPFSLGGVDATTYYHLLASDLSRDADPAKFLAQSYDPEAKFFCDVLPRTGKRTSARPSTGFLALLLESRPEVVRRWLINPDEFWLAAGFPATAQSDGTFSAAGEWKGKRLNRPWNGRSWPMANSAIVDVLAKVSESDPSLRVVAGEALMKVIRLMFHDGEPNRPNSYEHYDPESGMASLYRGYDDYMHSWIVDLILRHAVGIIPGSSRIDPLPLDVEWIRCEQIWNQGRFVDVDVRGRN